ncbi:Hsp20/alpha crystallin family protein [Kutzneria sp. NPDC051319]|uniref:Hsp20/alpha crystallin family protein n=1 Tax=Kutzneria sp. NPDC051319 TaxID=3155047 RepID=UPI00341F3A7B
MPPVPWRPRSSPGSSPPCRSADGALTISAKREQAKHDGQQSEFRYGGVSRTVALPAAVEATKVSASYTNGILEIHGPIEKSMSPHRVPISFNANK